MSWSVWLCTCPLVGKKCDTVQYISHLLHAINITGT